MSIVSLKDLRVAPYDIKPGNVMTYFPEANVLVRGVTARALAVHQSVEVVDGRSQPSHLVA